MRRTVASDDESRVGLNVLRLVHEHADVVRVRAEVRDLVEGRRGDRAQAARCSARRRARRPWRNRGRRCSRGRRRRGRARQALGVVGIDHGADSAGNEIHIALGEYYRPCTHATGTRTYRKSSHPSSQCLHTGPTQPPARQRGERKATVPQSSAQP